MEIRATMWSRRSDEVVDMPVPWAWHVEVAVGQQQNGAADSIKLGQPDRGWRGRHCHGTATGPVGKTGLSGGRWVGRCGGGVGVEESGVGVGGGVGVEWEISRCQCLTRVHCAKKCHGSRSHPATRQQIDQLSEVAS